MNRTASPPHCSKNEAWIAFMGKQRMKRFLLRHLGNMGDMVFFVPPVLESLKKHYPGCHITFVTAWGFKEGRRKWLAGRSRGCGWGKRNQGGFSIHVLQTNPHIDQLVHWHDSMLSLEGDICEEEGKRFPTWNRAYWEQQKNSGDYDGVFELDFGLTYEDNPIQRMYEAIGLPEETFSKYQIYLTPADREVGQRVVAEFPRPRIVLLEGLASQSTRGWDPVKVTSLQNLIYKQYGVEPLWFGGSYARFFEGREITLRENIASLAACDVAIGVMSGPLHFAAAVGLTTIALFGDQPLHRAAPAYFLNAYIDDPKKQHRTILGPTGPTWYFLKNDEPSINLTPQEAIKQGGKNWLSPGRQATKSCIAAITASEVATVISEVI